MRSPHSLLVAQDRHQLLAVRTCPINRSLEAGSAPTFSAALTAAGSPIITTRSSLDLHNRGLPGKCLQKDHPRSPIQKSQEAFDQAIRLNPRNADAYFGLAELALLMADSGKDLQERIEAAAHAETALSKALAIKQNLKNQSLSLAERIKATKNPARAL